MASSMAAPVARTQVIRALREVIAALDRRVGHARGAREATIALESGTLRGQAVSRLDALVREETGAAEHDGPDTLSAPASD